MLDPVGSRALLQRLVVRPSGRALSCLHDDPSQNVISFPELPPPLRRRTGGPRPGPGAAAHCPQNLAVLQRLASAHPLSKHNEGELMENRKRSRNLGETLLCKAAPAPVCLQASCGPCQLCTKPAVHCATYYWPVTSPLSCHRFGPETPVPLSVSPSLAQILSSAKLYK